MLDWKIEKKKLNNVKIPELIFESHYSRTQFISMKKKRFSRIFFFYFEIIDGLDNIQDHNFSADNLT